MDTTKVDDGLPLETQRDLWNKLPGELVMKYEHRNEYNTKTWGLEFAVRKTTAGVHFPHTNAVSKTQPPAQTVYEAATPYRACVYQAESPEAAVGALLMGVALFSRDGHMNPEHPTAMGSPPIQHVLSILSERLVWHSERRREHITNAPADATPDQRLDEATIARISRDNEIISALATSIAALARVKDL